MRNLFTLDKKNYDPNGTVGRRPSVRGIIVSDGSVAMMHSLKYDYYKLPGGGIEEGESLEDTLVREVHEESGLVVKRDSIREFGYVRRIEKGRYEDIFIQENFYFLCEVEEQLEAQKLDAYEEEERFVLEFVIDAFESNELPVPIRHVAENQSLIDFELDDGSTLSVKTNKRKLDKVAPQKIGQPTSDTYFDINFA